MTDLERLAYLKLALRVAGVIAIFGIYPLTVLWPSGWSWSSGRSEYLEMIIAIYATLGVFLFVASRNPSQHRHLVKYRAWRRNGGPIHSRSDAHASPVRRCAGTLHHCRCARVSLAGSISSAFRWKCGLNFPSADECPRTQDSATGRYTAHRGSNVGNFVDHPIG